MFFGLLYLHVFLMSIQTFVHCASSDSSSRNCRSGFRYYKVIPKPIVTQEPWKIKNFSGMKVVVPTGTPLYLVSIPVCSLKPGEVVETCFEFPTNYQKYYIKSSKFCYVTEDMKKQIENLENSGEQELWPVEIELKAPIGTPLTWKDVQKYCHYNVLSQVSGAALALVKCGAFRTER